MSKSKLCSLVIVGMIGFVGISPINSFATKINVEASIRSEKNQDQKEEKQDYKEKMKKASEKWKTLTPKQKEEVYGLIVKQMELENQVMNKLVELGVMEKEDIALMQARRLERFNRIKESGDFPLVRQRSNKRSE